jgi:hypothetical protein
MTSKLDGHLRNAARGSLSYQDSTVREKISNLILGNPLTPVSALSDFLGAQLFTLRAAGWRVLAFTDRDERTLHRLRQPAGVEVDRNYARLLVSYILANAKRVEEMYSRSRRLTSAMFEQDADAAVDILTELPQEDRQSIFAFRLYGTTSASSDVLVKYFSDNINSQWVRQRFLYPFVYYSVSAPSDEYIDTFLSLIVVEQGDLHTRTAIMKLLLNPDAAVDENLAFKCYAAMLAHPFDACEIFLSHLEYSFAENGRLAEFELELLGILSKRLAVRFG